MTKERWDEIMTSIVLRGIEAFNVALIVGGIGLVIYMLVWME